MGKFYDQLLADTTSDSISKTASTKDVGSIKLELERAGMSASKLQSLAGEICGMIEKTADTIPTSQPDTAVAVEAPVAQPIDPAATPATDLQLDADQAAIQSAKASISDAGVAIQALENLNGAEEVSEVETQLGDQPVSGTEMPATEMPAIANPAEKQASEGDEPNEDEAESEEDKGEDGESEDDEDEDKKASRAFTEMMKTASEEEKEVIIKEAYDKASAKLMDRGITLGDYVFSRVGDENLSNTIAEKSIKLASLSNQSSLRVVDMVIDAMEKIASEL